MATAGMNACFNDDRAVLGKLYGLKGLDSEGMVIEVHLDIMDASERFLHRLTELGFEDDPFVDFYPPQYVFHYTGRTRSPRGTMRKTLSAIHSLVNRVIVEARLANVQMYAESELVRDIRHFAEHEEGRTCCAMQGIVLENAGKADTAKADIHVEFRRGNVSEEARSLLTSHSFYWVTTPASARFPAEEIATLQTARFQDAMKIYKVLASAPLPTCTGIHLEQKLSMVGSHPGLPMPQVHVLSAGT